jgi:hypothetical protein
VYLFKPPELERPSIQWVNLQNTKKIKNFSISIKYFSASFVFISRGVYPQRNFILKKMTANQKQKTCLGCTQSKGHICSDVHTLLYRLHIPPQEQAILWSMATEKVGCTNFKNILSSLQNKLS